MTLSSELVKRVWSRIRQVVSVVTSPVGADAATTTAPPEAADAVEGSQPGPSAAPASATDDAFAQALAHLEYLGYETRLQPDGWTFARHPYRYDFFLRMFPGGIRLHCHVGIGASNGNSRASWLDFLNSANDRSFLTRFSLAEDDAAAQLIRMRAMISGSYSRSGFSMLMDMWHDDLDLVRRKPEFPSDSSTEEDDDTEGVTVN